MKPFSFWVFAFLLTVWGIFVMFQARAESQEVVTGVEMALCGVSGMLLAVFLDRLYTGGRDDTSN